MRKAWIVLVFLPLAGCLGGNGEDMDDALADRDLQVADTDPFFSDVPYDADLLDLSTLSAPVYDILPVEEVWVPSSIDGKRIHNAVYRPDTEEPVPVWINFSPYWGDTATTDGDAYAQYMIDNFVPRGYAVVLSAIRGTGHSEGCFQIAGDLELQDSYDVVDHFATTPWSNGAVGAGGKSYDSTTQNGLIAKFPHPALRAVFHVSGITDMYRYNYREGIPYANGLQFTPRYYLTQGLDEYLGATNSAGTTDDEDQESLVRLIDDVACPELAEHVVSGEGSAVTGLKDAYWIERDWNRFIGDSDWDGSIFFVHGFQDWNVKPDHILPFLERMPEDVEVLAWLHQDQQGGTGHVYPMRLDWNLTMLRWMDETLKGIDTGIFDEPRYHAQGTDGLWRASETWPPEPTEVPVEGGEVAEAGDEPLRYSGQLSIRLPVTVTNPDGVLTVTLFDEAPDGTQTWVNEAVLRLLYAEGLDLPTPVVPGDTLEVTAEFYPQDDVLGPGHKWVLGVQGTPRHSLALPTQLLGVEPELSQAVMWVPWADAAAPAAQPTPMACITC